VTASTGAALMGLGLETTTYHVQDIKAPNFSWKNINSSGSNFDSLYKSGSVDSTLPVNPHDWKETTHPEAGKKEHRTFENKKNG